MKCTLLKEERERDRTSEKEKYISCRRWHNARTHTHMRWGSNSHRPSILITIWVICPSRLSREILDEIASRFPNGILSLLLHSSLLVINTCMRGLRGNDMHLLWIDWSALHHGSSCSTSLSVDVLFSWANISVHRSEVPFGWNAWTWTWTFPSLESTLAEQHSTSVINYVTLSKLPCISRANGNLRSSLPRPRNAVFAFDDRITSDESEIDSFWSEYIRSSACRWIIDLRWFSFFSLRIDL